MRFRHNWGGQSERLEVVVNSVRAEFDRLETVTSVKVTFIGSQFSRTLTLMVTRQQTSTRSFI
ncbi:MAG: hypothetical protein DHS20C15_34980 [Planctomycetota bacterium]|nr:MAG: hypothetical protein DHS20C15_34980 [Planctomycetota bacterium]